jgi:hypothetical protein
MQVIKVVDSCKSGTVSLIPLPINWDSIEADMPRIEADIARIIEGSILLLVVDSLMRTIKVYVS